MQDFNISFCLFDRMIFKGANYTVVCKRGKHQVVGKFLQFMTWQLRPLLLQIALKMELADCREDE